MQGCSGEQTATQSSAYLRDLSTTCRLLPYLVFGYPISWFQKILRPKLGNPKKGTWHEFRGTAGLVTSPKVRPESLRNVHRWAGLGKLKNSELRSKASNDETPNVTQYKPKGVCERYIWGV